MSEPKAYEFDYARVSEYRGKKYDEGSSVPGQLTWLAERAAAKGRTVLATIKEHSIEERPGYKELLRIIPIHIRRIRAKEPDAKFYLATREDTRLSRRPMEREQLLEICGKLGLWFTWADMDYNPIDPIHRYMIRSTGASAALTSDMTSFKVNTKVARRIADGVPHGKMPLIYIPHHDPITGAVTWKLDPVAGPATKKAIESILDGTSGPDGHSVSAAAEYFRKKTKRTTATQSFRRMILLPTLAGIRTHKKAETGVGKWPALITKAQHRRLVAILTSEDRATNTRGTKPIHLLSYIAYCGRPECGSRKIAPTSPFGKRKPGYKCSECNKLGVIAEPVDVLAEFAIIELLEDPRIVEALNEKDESDDQFSELQDELTAAEDEMAEYYALAKAHELSPRGLVEMESELLPRIEDLKAQVKAAVRVGGSILARYAGSDAGKVWHGVDSKPGLPIEVKRELVRAGLTVTILPASSPGKRFTPDRIDIRWRVPL